MNDADLRILISLSDSLRLVDHEGLVSREALSSYFRFSLPLIYPCGVKNRHFEKHDGH